MTREEAIDLLDNLNGMIEDSRNSDYDTAFKMAIKALEQEPKTGHWIEVTNGRGGHECDLCHEYAPSYKDGDEWLTKYCPICGAKMVEPQESEE